MAKASNDGTKEKAGAGNPPKNLNKVSKRKSDITARMVVRALNSMDRMPERRRKDGEGGHSLAAIRSYFEEEYGLSMKRHKDRQSMLKDIIRKEVDEGRIGMVNFNGPINFTKRFEVAADVDENELESESALSDEE
ncbi:hypothetical protein HA402_004457 [Bradysia odoriphaga]|nr:hypothetical protein HA402_004457 [Bradysia odoriphaga]